MRRVQGSAVLLLSLCIAGILMIYSSSTFLMSRYALKQRGAALNYLEGFPSAEIPALNAALLASKGTIPAGAKQADGTYATSFYADYTKDLPGSLKAGTYNSKSYSPNNALNVLNTSVYDNKRTLFQRLSGNVFASSSTAADGTQTLCGRYPFSNGDQIRTCLSIPKSVPATPPGTSAPLTLRGFPTGGVIDSTTNELYAGAIAVRNLTFAPKDLWDYIVPSARAAMISYTDVEARISRFNADLSIDSKFAGSGQIATGLRTKPTALREEGNRLFLELTKDGSKSFYLGVVGLSGGSFALGATSAHVLLRYTSAGVLDTTFNKSGFVAYNQNGSAESFGGLYVESDHSVLAVGSTGGVPYITKYDKDGKNIYFKSLPISVSGTMIFSSVREPDGSILMVGEAVSSNTGVICKITNVSSSPSVQWTATIPLQASTYRYALRVNILGVQEVGSERRTLALTTANTGFWVHRFTSAGSVDNTFGTSGKIQKAPEAPYTSMLGLTGKVLSDGKILVTGRRATDNLGAEGFVYRFTSDGNTDLSFNNGNVATYGPTETRVLLTYPDGKIIGLSGKQGIVSMRFPVECSWGGCEQTAPYMHLVRCKSSGFPVLT